jgi:hypothetical protein
MKVINLASNFPVPGDKDEEYIDQSTGIAYRWTGSAYIIFAYAVTLNADMADSGTAGSSFVVCPFAGTLIGLAAVNHLANTTTKTVLTAKIAGSAVTIPAWEIAVTAAAGTPTAVVPTAANAVTAGQAIEFLSDGGSATAAQKTTFTATVLRNI